MRRYRIPTFFVAATLTAGALLALLIGVAVTVAAREWLGARLDARTDLLLREMVLWATLAWLPFGALIAWYVGRRIADRLEVTREYARELAWFEHPGARPPTAIVDVRRLEEALSGYFTDVRDELATALRHRDEALRLVNAVGEGLLQLDGAGRVVRLNPAAARLLHLSGEALGHPIDALVRTPELRAFLQRPAPPDAADSSELTVESRRLLVIRQPLGEGRAPAGTIVVVVDLTPLRKLEDVRREFVANVSHELKTPLTAIRGYVETLQDPGLSESQRRQFLDATMRNAERLQRLVDDLLDLSRIESGGWRPDLEPVDAALLAQDAWSACAERAAARGVAFQVSSEADSAPVVSADPHGLRQVLLNLYDNALRYTPAGGRIEVRLRRVEPRPPAPPDASPPAVARDVVEISVADTGSGIPAEALPRIFERFYRVDPSRSREEGGTGLGLSIVKHVVERMGGDVLAESRLGAGTTVRVTLPAAVPAPISAEKA